MPHTLSNRMPPLWRAHWFCFVAPLVLLADVGVGLSARGQIDQVIEAGLLFDLAVLIPGLYLACYRREGRKAALRAIGLACLGIWAALKLVPADEQQLLSAVAPLRYLGLAVLLLVEVVIVVRIYRVIFGSGSAEKAVAAAGPGMPPWVARLMAWEAGVWLRAWRALRRVFGR